MNPILKNILAVISGVIVGSLVNNGLIMLGHAIIPPPGDTSTMEGLAESMLLFGPKDFIFPFIAHAGGTLVGAFIAAKLAANKQKVFALVIGGVFLLGGISMVSMLPSPIWYTILDLTVAYIPMAWIAWKLSTFGKSKGLPIENVND
jgi:hypothetical protein